jgi:hypothetical protein
MILFLNGIMTFSLSLLVTMLMLKVFDLFRFQMIKFSPFTNNSYSGIIGHRRHRLLVGEFVIPGRVKPSAM